METLVETDIVSEVIPTSSDIILLEDDLGQVGRVRDIAHSRGLGVLSVSDLDSVVAMAERGGRFFVLDIKVGRSSEHTSAGLKALAALRARYKDGVFIAVYSGLLKRHENAVHNLCPDIALSKTTDDRRDFALIFEEWTRWLSRREAKAPIPIDTDLLLPSDSLAVRIARVTQDELEQLHSQRVSLAKVLRREPPRLEDLVREIGARMRDEVRGALRGLAERGFLEGKRQVDLTNGPRLTSGVVRSLLRTLPITYGADEILAQLRSELYLAARYGLAGEWGSIKLVDDRVVLFPPEGGL